MSKSWIILIMIATFTLLGWTGFQFYLAITGKASEVFTYESKPIAGPLPTGLLEDIGKKSDKVPVKIDQIKTKSENLNEEPSQE